MAKRMTFCAIGLALTVISLYGASVLSTGRLAALALSAVFSAVCVERFGVRYGLVLYIGASALSLLFIPKRLFVLSYVLFVGYYPVVKLYIEQLHKLWAEWLIKLLYFNAILILFYILFQTFFLSGMESTLVGLVLRYLGPIVLGLEVVFVIFDIMLSYMVDYYHQMLRRMGHE